MLILYHDDDSCWSFPSHDPHQLISQGEMIDRIEYHVEKASEYVEAAKDDTKKAVVFKSRSRKVSVSLCLMTCLMLKHTWHTFLYDSYFIRKDSYWLMISYVYHYSCSILSYHI